MIIILTIVIAFLCGSIPTGYLLTKKICQVDIRTKGSGNIGSTNVKRIAGTKVSIITQVFDILKGLIPVAFSIYLVKTASLPISGDVFLAIVALVVILGHDYTPFLKFNGGKGVNTTLGAFFLLAPIPTLGGVAVYFILRMFTSIVSIRSLSIGVSIPVLCLIMKVPYPIVISATAACAIMILRHKENLKRLINHEEK